MKLLGYKLNINNTLLSEWNIYILIDSAYYQILKIILALISYLWSMSLLLTYNRNYFLLELYRMKLLTSLGKYMLEKGLIIKTNRGAKPFNKKFKF